MDVARRRKGPQKLKGEKNMQKAKSPRKKKERVQQGFGRTKKTPENHKQTGRNLRGVSSKHTNKSSFTRWLGRELG